MKKKSHRFPVLLIHAAIALSFIGCVSKFDETSHESFKDLKTFHLGFIDEFTEGEGKSWDAEAFSQQVQTGMEKFNTALAYEMSKKKPDPTRTKAFNILMDQFKSDSEFIKNKDALLKKYFSGQLRTQVEENYDLALKGELSRDQ